jgi:hypothetical protein
MNELKRESEIEQLCGEVNAHRITLDEAITQIAKRFGVDASVCGAGRAVSTDMALTWAWQDAEREMLLEMENAEDVRRHVIDAVKNGDMSPSDALDIYCAASEANPTQLLYFADDYLDYDPVEGAKGAIDAAYRGGDISDIIAYVDSESGRRAEV